MTFKEKYLKEIDNIPFASGYETRIINGIKSAGDGKESILIMKKRKTIRLIVAVVAAILLLSVSAFAISSLLSPDEVAEEVGKIELINKWQKSENFPYVSGDEIYTVSVLGFASDEELNNYDGVEVEENRTYVVVSIARTDGTPLSSSDGMPLQISPFVQDYEPWKVNLWMLGSNANGLQKDGILYYLFDTADLEIFADKTVYIAAYEGFLPSADTEDGTIGYNDTYTGFKAIFELPLDASKADHEAVKELLSQIGY